MFLDRHGLRVTQWPRRFRRRGTRISSRRKPREARDPDSEIPASTLDHSTDALDRFGLKRGVVPFRKADALADSARRIARDGAV